MSSSNVAVPELSNPGAATVTEYHRGEPDYTMDSVKEQENKGSTTERK